MRQLILSHDFCLWEKGEEWQQRSTLPSGKLLIQLAGNDHSYSRRSGLVVNPSVQKSLSKSSAVVVPIAATIRPDGSAACVFAPQCAHLAWYEDGTLVSSSPLADRCLPFLPTHAVLPLRPAYATRRPSRITLPVVLLCTAFGIAGIYSAQTKILLHQQSRQPLEEAQAGQKQWLIHDHNATLQRLGEVVVAFPEVAAKAINSRRGVLHVGGLWQLDTASLQKSTRRWQAFVDALTTVGQVQIVTNPLQGKWEESKSFALVLQHR